MKEKDKNVEEDKVQHESSLPRHIATGVDPTETQRYGKVMADNPSEGAIENRSSQLCTPKAGANNGTGEERKCDHNEVGV